MGQRGRKVLAGALAVALGFTLFGRWLGTPAGNAWLADQVELLVTGTMAEGRLEIDGLETNLVSRLQVRGVRLLDGTGRKVIEIPRISAQYDVRPLIRRALLVEQVLVDSPVVDLRTDDAGALDLSRMFPSEEDSGPSSGLPGTLLILDARVVSGTVGYHDAAFGLQVRRLDVAAAVTGRHKTWEVHGLTVDGEVTEPEMGVLTLDSTLTLSDLALDLESLALGLGEARVNASGRVTGLDGDAPALGLDLAVAQLDFDKIEPLSGDLGLHGAVGATLRAEGTLSEPRIQGSVQAGGGELGVDLSVNTAAEPLAWSGTLEPRGLDLGSVVDAVTEPTVLSGKLTASGSGTEWPASVKVEGTVDLEDSLAWGYAIPGLDGEVRVSDGQVGLKNVRFAAPYGVLNGDGRLTESGLALDVRANLWDLRALEQFSAPGLRGDARANGELRIDWSGALTEVRFVGALEGTSLAYESEFTAGAWSSTADVLYLGDTTVRGELFAENVESYGLTLGIVRGPYLVEVLESGPLRWEADVAAENLDGFGGTIVGAAGYVDGSIDEADVLRTDLAFGLEGLAYDQYTAGAGVAEVHLAGDALGVDIDLYSGDENVLRLEGSSDLADSTWNLSELRVGAESGVSWKNREPIALRLTDDGVAEARVALSSSAGTIDVRGQLGQTGPLDAEIVVEGLQLAWLGAMFPEDLGGWTGSAAMTLTLAGTGAAPELRGDARVQALSIPGQLWGTDVQVKLDARDQLAKVTLRVADQRGGLLTGEAALPARLDLTDPAIETRAPIRAEMVLFPTTFERLQTAIPALGELPKGELSAQLLVDETLIDPHITLKAGVQLPAGQNGEWARTDIDLTTHEGLVTLTAAGYEGGERRLNVDGTASTSLRDITAWILEDGPEPDLESPETYIANLAVTAVPLGVPMEALGAFVELPEGFDGRLSGALILSGQPDKPQLGGGLQITEGKLGDVIVSPAVIGLSPAEGGYQFFGTFGFSEDPAELGQYSFELAGYVPFSADLGGDFDLDAELAREGLVVGVRGTGLPLGLLSAVDPAIQDAKGVIDIEGQVVGSLAKPRPQLDVLLEDGSFRYSDLELNFDAVKLIARVEAESVDVREFRFHTAPTDPSRDDVFDQAARNMGKAVRIPDGRQVEERCEDTLALAPGEALVYGRAQLDTFALAAVNFDVCARDAWLSATDDLILQFSAGLDMRGAWPEVDVTGDVLAKNVFFSMNEADFFDTGALELDPALRVVRTGVQTVSAKEEAEKAFYYPWDVRVDVDLNRAATLSVTVPLLDTYDSLGLSSMTLDDTELDGEITYHQKGDLIEIFGDIKTLRGTVEVMGNNFELREGNIVFSGESYTNPTLDILAVLDAGSYGEIGVNVSQTAEQPAIDFSSDAGYTITDILAILLMGRPTSELGQANSGGLSDIFAFASTQASGVLSQQAEVFGGQGNLIDSFQVGSSDAQMFSTLTFGRSVGDRAYVEVEINRDPDPEEGDYPTEIGVEYVLSRRLEGVIRMGGENSADVYANWRF